MKHFEPALGIWDAAMNARKFVRSNKCVFWKIMMPLIPFVVLLAGVDFVLDIFLFREGSVNSILCQYAFTIFYLYIITMVLRISWHRFVQYDAENFKPMRIFRPKENEFVFIGMGLLFVFGSVFFSWFIFYLGSVMAIGNLFLPLFFAVFLFIIFMLSRLSFFFPAKAIDSSISLMQAYKMSDGLAINIIMATILAILPTLVVSIGFYYSAYGGLIMFAQEMKSTPFSGAGVTLVGLLFLLRLVVKMYSIPLIFVIGVTVLSNYYQYALCNNQDFYDQSASS